MWIQRLADRSQERIDELLDAGRYQGSPVELEYDAWVVDEIPGPDITNRETVLSMARMAANAYVLDDQGEGWYDIGNGFNYTDDFGWRTDGLRGHVFADTENATVVISLKGTSPAVFDGSGTTTNDKINDNLFFSCCCGQGGRYGWLQVCDCQTSAFSCNSTCVVEALWHKNRYYYAAQEIYQNVTEIFPNSDIWIVGHSLGGSTGSLIALTYGLPVVTFEAPGEAMPAKRLGLPTPPGYRLGDSTKKVSTGGFHFGHTADPIYMGTCNTYSSVCTIAGYAMQSVCHTGATCVYDTVGDLGWRVGAGTHRINAVIKDVLEKYEEAAKCVPLKECVDCFNWEFYESNHSSSSTTRSGSTSTKTTSTHTTRTSTCKTPGWWGCLDESTTTKSSSTKTTVTTTTTTTTTSKEVKLPPEPTTCETPGWFGCNDPTTTSHDLGPTDPGFEPPVGRTHTITTAPKRTAPATTTATSTSATSSTTCVTPGWFGCRDSTSTSTSGPTVTSTAVPDPTAAPTCVRRAWWGRCKEWGEIDEHFKADL
jgi:lipase ATG15